MNTSKEQIENKGQTYDVFSNFFSKYKQLYILFLIKFDLTLIGNIIYNTLILFIINIRGRKGKYVRTKKTNAD